MSLSADDYIPEDEGAVGGVGVDYIYTLNIMAGQFFKSQHASIEQSESFHLGKLIGVGSIHIQAV